MAGGHHRYPPHQHAGHKIDFGRTAGSVGTGMTSTGSEGLDLVNIHQPDLILMDYRLPEGQADQYIAQMKNLSAHSHIIILTDEDNVKLFRHLISLGASGMLSKQASLAS